MVKPKIPRTPANPLSLRAEDLVHLESNVELWRIHRTQGSAHIASWNQFRHYGPLPSMRWDPHPPPAATHQLVSMMYTATTPATAIAEVGQVDRTVDTISGRPYLTSWFPTRTLDLVNLTGTWAVRNGAARSLDPASRSVCRAWAQAIHAQFPDIDGLWVTSTITGKPNVVLWTHAADALPLAPTFARALADPALRPVIARIAARDLGYAII